MRRLALLGGIALVALLAASARGDEVRSFLDRHWRGPLAPQGSPPAGFAAVEASLAPEACGTCHPAQFADWRTSLHAAAMGPGVAGQLVELLRADREEALGCLPCHAPLAEQSPASPAFDRALHARGVVCAACHVRGHERFGPPRRDGSLGGPAEGAPRPHGGATRTPAFLRSEFCAGCHQFAPDGFALGGTLLSNTLEEWRQSRFAREGVQCQDCHMPDRRHLWRGIHDREMVRSGLTITARAGAARYRPGEDATVTLTVESTGVGHAFPTYVTPRVVLRVELVDRRGRPVPGSRRERVIAREVTLDLSRQVADTRLGPGERATLEYRRRVDRAGLSARLSVVVEPDAFYTRFFEARLREGAGRGAAQLRQALAATRRSPFTVFTQDLPLSRAHRRGDP